MNPLLQYWYFHLPNFVLAALMYTVLGRLLLSFFAPPGWQNYIWRFFTTVTDPIVKLVRCITPLAVPDNIVLIFAALWLIVLRVAFYVLLGSFGLLPSVAGGA